MKKIVFLSIMFIAFFTACKKDLSSNNTPDVGELKLPATPVSGAVAGMITDENNYPVENAQVTISGSVYLTNNKGVFQTADLNLDKYISTVKVSKQGYYTGYRSFCAGATLNYVNIKLIPKVITGIWNTGSGGDITLANGCSISFQANSMKIKSSGASYTGTVNVFASYIDPTSQDIALTMPGSNMAEDEDKFYVTRSLGTIAVELESTTGESLQLVTGKPATMELSIPSSLQSHAPETIDTWSLDERGIWIKKGKASKSGSVYNMEVDHFSYWTSNIPVTPVFLTMNFKNQDNRPLANANIVVLGGYITGTNSNYYGGGSTDELGTLRGMVPANESLQYSIVFGCYPHLRTGSIGPYTTDATENFIFNMASAEVVDIIGTALDCSGNPVANGTVEIYLNAGPSGYAYAFRRVDVVNGNFTCYFPICPGSTISSLDFVVIDSNTMQQSATVTLPFANTINTGALSACGISTNEFINYVLDGTNFVISSSDPVASFDGIGNSFTQVSGGTTGAHFFAGFLGNTIGNFPLVWDSVMVNGYYSPVLPGASGTITNFAPVSGQFFEGFFDIPFVEAGVNHTLTGVFRVKRDN